MEPITRWQAYRQCIAQRRLALLIKLDWRLTVIDFDYYFRPRRCVAKARQAAADPEARRR